MSQAEAYYHYEEFDVSTDGLISEEDMQDAFLEVLEKRRREDGLEVALLWNKLDNVVQIRGVHEITHAEFSFPIEPDQAVHALDNPIRYAHKAGIPTQGVFPTVREAA